MDLSPIDAAVRGVVIGALRNCGTLSEAAIYLRISRWSLSRLIKRLGIKEEDYGRLGGRAVVDEGE